MWHMPTGQKKVECLWTFMWPLFTCATNLVSHAPKNTYKWLFPLVLVNTGFHYAKYFIFFQNYQIPKPISRYQTNARHVCTYLNAIPMVIYNIVTINTRILTFLNICWHFYLSSAHACCVVSVNISQLVTEHDLEWKNLSSGRW